MNKQPVYAASDLSPIQLAPFDLHQRRHDMARARQGMNVTPLPGEFDVKTLVQPTAVAAIRKAFLLAKTSHRNWKTHQREGRFDIRSGMRAVRREQDVFKQKRGQSVTRVKVSVLIDASGSMHDPATIANPVKPGKTIRVTRTMAAAIFGATIATALGKVPTVDLDVFQHGASSTRLYLKWRWAKGTPVAVFNDAAYGGVGGGGNADGHALYAITERMRHEIKRDERGIIMVVSDGLPSQTSPTSRLSPGQALSDAVAHARKAGFEVMAVAIDGSDQTAYYGPKGVVTFDGDWNALGSALARHIGAALAPR